MERRNQGHSRPEAEIGLTLVTTDQEVIRRWADERGAEPARLNHPDGDTRLRFITKDGTTDGEDEGLEPVSWEEWLATFERAGLRFVYRDGQPPEDGFYRLEHPDRG